MQAQTILLIAAAACGLAAQTTDTRPSFEVASVKPDLSETGVDRLRNAKGSLIVENVSLRRIIAIAYGIPEGQDYLLSGPDWLDSERFDIWAKFPPETPDPDFLLMLQRLLDERFAMRLHRETKEFSAYALVIAKTGPKLRAAAAPNASYKFTARAGHALGSSISMTGFAGWLSRPSQLGRPVVDFTGLNGTFDLTLDWSLEGTPLDQMTAPSIFTAVQEQLGLKLEPRKLPLEVLLVDDAHKVPTAN